jgi:predicted RNase H-like HicB family nuclease
MLTEYIQAAMRCAKYEIIDDPKPFYGEIPQCEGVWANGATLEECRRNLQEVMEGWLILSLQRSFPIPAIEGIELTKEEPAPVHG